MAAFGDLAGLRLIHMWENRKLKSQDYSYIEVDKHVAVNAIGVGNGNIHDTAEIIIIK